MELTLLAGGSCADVDMCPTVFQADHLAVVIGDEVTDPSVLAKVRLGPGERLVTIPLAMLVEAARRVRAERQQ